MKKYVPNKYVLIIIGVLISVSIVLVAHYTAISYTLSGTYTAGNEPDSENIYVALNDGQFTAYNQEKVLVNAMLEKVNLNRDSEVYRLISGGNTSAGYLLHDKNYIVLLDFNGVDLSLKKISKNPIYLKNESDETPVTMIRASDLPTISVKDNETLSLSVFWDLEGVDNIKVVFNCDIKTDGSPEQNWLKTENVEVYIEADESYEWITSGAYATMPENKSYILISINGDLSKDNKFINTFNLDTTVYNEKHTNKLID